ncbi:tRNA (guanine(37)-N1)-methyltransferase [Eumeta japonica]|uniref:tRNA (guanine(37)-N1)-methyltransferase n=1 Tax=Eumeta variegata TaxID=151549 RepID=A0A4C1W8U7_EUMVA|nr:tRNA (guanine(37)-N1)-methyltransferase [Eumeta japonica]
MSGPKDVRGMQVFDRNKFLHNLNVPTLQVEEDKLSKIIQCCKKYFFKVDNFKPVQNIVDLKDEEESQNNDHEKKCIYLNPDKIKTWTDFMETDRIVLRENGVKESDLKIRKIQLSYENWSIDQIFKAVLPENEEGVSGWSQIGHIIHLNLRDHLLDYKSLIGQVLVDKIKSCRTVVNKSNIIDTTYRNFSMELLAGDKNFMVTVKENKCTFEFDFSKVYWNPRLGKEHERILGLLKPNDVLFDVFCGVGPFAIPAAKKKCKVYANDLNPESFKWLNHNAQNNKVNQLTFQSYNCDGKDFIYNVFREYLIDVCKGNEKIAKNAKIQITMNLPAMAVEFLKYFKGLIDDRKYYNNFDCEIIVHVYCFAIGDDPKHTAVQMVNEHMEYDITEHVVEIFDVRNVSPKKEMMRVSFFLTRDILFHDISAQRLLEENAPPKKKICIEPL